VTICIDIRNLAQKQHSGIGVYTMNLINNLLKIDQKNQYKLFYNSKKYQLIKTYYKNVKYYDFHKSNRLLNLTMFLFNYPKINKIIGDCDVFFAPNINFFALDFNNKKIKKIITIHDLSFVFFKKFYSPKSILWHNIFINIKRILNKFDYIITVSENTKNDLIKYFNISENKIATAYLGVEQIVSSTLKKETLKPQIRKEILDVKMPYLLNINTIEPRKNIEGIISAFTLLKEKKEYQNINLIIAGGKGWNSKYIYKILEKNKFKNNIKVFDYINNDEKEYLYNNAKIFLFPSFYEGFGLPIIEAQSRGIPVVTSANSSLSEISGNNVIFINPHNINEILFAIQELLGNKDFYELSKKNGLENSKKFTWEKCARETLKIIERNS